MNRIKKLNLKVASYLNIVAIIIAIIVHFLVIFQIVPYNWINGGRSIDLASAQKTSVISIGILLVMILINLLAYKMFKNKKIVIVLKILLWILFVYSIFGFLQQLFGTTFEKFSMNLLCLVNVIMYYRLAIEIR